MTTSARWAYVALLVVFAVLLTAATGNPIYIIGAAAGASVALASHIRRRIR